MDPSRLSDKDLLHRCILGDQNAWNEFVTRFQKLIVHSIHNTLLIKRFTPVQTTYDELFQDVFLSLVNNDYRKLRQFRGENRCSLGNWLRIIAVRATIDFVRRERPRVHAEDCLDETEGAVERIPDKEELADAAMEDQEKHRQLKSLLSALSPRERYFFDLSYHKELPDAEVAEILGISLANCHTIRSRIKEKLTEMVRKKEFCKNDMGRTVY